MVTISDVARHAGVSKATVSRVLAGRASVAADIAARVQQAMQILDYQPNAMARGLAMGRSNTVGMVVNDFEGPYYGLMMRGVEDVCEQSGLQLMVASGHADAMRERDATRLLLQRQCDGVVLHSDGLADADLVPLLDGERPVVLINRLVPSHADRCVYSDDTQGGALAAQHLLQHGHRAIGCITGPLHLHEPRARLAGFANLLKAAGVGLPDEWVVEADFREQGGYRAALHLLDIGAPITALFVQNDQMAAGVMIACRERGLDLPHQLSIIGFDDIVFARFLYPRLSTIRQPLREMGQAAAALLLQANGAPLALQPANLFVPSLVCRDSVSTVSV